jgi:hypothetical protein
VSPGAPATARKGSGCLIFAGVVMFLAGALNVVDGVATITDSRFYTPRHVDYIVGNLHARAGCTSCWARC